MEADMKECYKCKQTKDLADFYKANYKSHLDGYDYYCKYCRVGSAIKTHRGNKKQCSIDDCERVHYAHTYCRMHYARFRRHGTTEAKNKPIGDDNIYYFAGKPYSKREYVLKYNYNMEISEYETRAADGCEICGDKPERSLHVDHDHKCCNAPKSCGNCVRGIICNRCNKAVDKYETNKMRADYPYIERIKEYVNGYKRSS
jgi:hypothetical protein